MDQMVLHQELPADLGTPRALPGIQPVQGPWLHVDEAYGGQMQLREALLETRPGDVLHIDEQARPAAEELLDVVLHDAPQLGFRQEGSQMIRPDGHRVILDRDTPLATLGRLMQCDFCLLEKRGAEHVLTGAVLCFPASWSLYEKAGQPLGRIHIPVDSYTPDLARRVQRLFDGIQPDRPIWRFNALWYDDPTLFQPRREAERRTPANPQTAPYFRSERQTLYRLPQTRAVVFAIHTYLIPRARVPAHFKPTP